MDVYFMIVHCYTHIMHFLRITFFTGILYSNYYYFNYQINA